MVKQIYSLNTNNTLTGSTISLAFRNKHFPKYINTNGMLYLSVELSFDRCDRSHWSNICGHLDSLHRRYMPPHMCQQYRVCDWDIFRGGGFLSHQEYHTNIVQWRVVSYGFRAKIHCLLYLVDLGSNSRENMGFKLSDPLTPFWGFSPCPHIPVPGPRLSPLIMNTLLPL